MKLAVKVVPGSSQERIVGWLGNALKIRVRQVAERGKANEAVLRLLSKTLDVPVGNMRIVSGSTSPNKVVEIPGMNDAMVRARVREMVCF